MPQGQFVVATKAQKDDPHGQKNSAHGHKDEAKGQKYKAKGQKYEANGWKEEDIGTIFLSRVVVFLFLIGYLKLSRYN